MTGGIAFAVAGKPIPQGSKTRSRYGHMFNDNDKTLRPWRRAVTAAATEAKDHAFGPCLLALQSGPIEVEVTFTLPKPASAPKRRTTWPCRKQSGDVDKLQRAVFDALTDAGVWGDDAQVVEVTARKVYPDEGIDALSVPGALVRIRSLAVA